MSQHGIRHVKLNTKERFTSTDYNDNVTLAHRAIIESIKASLHLTTSGIMGVLTGFYLKSTTGLSVTIDPGIALASRTPPTAYESGLSWIEKSTDTTIDLTSYVHGTLNRWVCIEISANDAATTSVVDIFDSNNAQSPFTSSVQDKVIASSPTFTVVAGTAASSPVLPNGGGTDRIPLLYVYLAAAAGSISTSDCVRCRPVISPEPFNIVVEGGGISTTDATSASLKLCPFRAAVSDVVPMQAPRITINILESGTPNIDGAVTYPPASDTVMYVYAVAPPWPTGYSANLAYRELITFGTRLPSAKFGVANCVILVTTAAPAVVVGNTLGSFSGAKTLKDPAWNNVTVSTGIYLGAIFVKATTGYTQYQNVQGDVVHLLGMTDAVTDSRTAADSGDVTGDLRKINPTLTTGTTFLPVTAQVVDLMVTLDTTGTGDAYTKFVDDVGKSYEVKISDNQLVRNRVTLLAINGTYTWRHSNTANGSQLSVWQVAYHDFLLESR